MTLSFSARAGALLSAAALGALVLTAAAPAAAYDCASPNPSDWPPPAKPYFMIAFDTSGSMDNVVFDAQNVAINPSCSGYPPSRLGHARCALSNMIKAYSGEVNFGLAAFARRIRKSGAADGDDPCPSQIGKDLGFNVPNCRLDNLYADTCGGAGQTTAAQGGNILVPLRQDDYFNTPPTSVSNAAALLNWVDNRCADCQELWSSGYTPLNGLLRDVQRYLTTSWTSPVPGSTALNTPLTGTERTCRSVNVILMTDGKESCEPLREDANNDPPTAAANAAAALLSGWNIGATHWSAKTYVVAIGGDAAVITDTNTIAAAGGTGTARAATNETQLSQALAAIIGDSVKPETCDNVDNNCNGCVDEGSKKYCNRNKTGRNAAYLNNAANNPGPADCCNDVRATCLTNFASSITAANPQGSKYWLPCWDPVTNGSNPDTKWVCSDPGEACDDKDNNCENEIDPSKTAPFAANVVDENQLKCGSPAHCPVAETCDNTDQNCDGVVDNATSSGVPFSVCPNNCQPIPEICNGCDDDCDGIADDGVSDLPCGFSPPAQCLGVRKCTPVAVATPGACKPGVTPPGSNQYGNCSATGTQETCNGVDDNCDGIVDNGVTGEGAACTPNVGDPTVGACQAGTRVCQNGTFACVGYVGPATEICDGIDNDCDGLIDAADPSMVGVNQVCGSGIGECRKGATACVAGTIVCQGGKQPQPEVCNGKDDDCNGFTDDSLTDVPANVNCWTGAAGGCNPTCSAAGVSWCPPAGATCTGVGTLQGVCKPGGLVCDGVNHWVCKGDQQPIAEVCNGADDNCNGQIDEGLGAPIGQACGQTVPNSPCKAGVLACVGGVQVCQGQVPPEAEKCNGIDDDCDTIIDNGVSAGSSCKVEYNHTEYPGPEREGPECPLGVTKCDGTGASSCVGGKGPQPEICDGKDNDCDGQIDESGVAPDGIDGSANPADPSQIIGEACGGGQGECKTGKWGCIEGRVTCTGSIGVKPEICDCLDNDCDGKIDEDDGDPNAAPLCSAGKTCINKNGACQCAEPCKSAEFPCPSGQTCEQVSKSGSPDVQDRFCIAGDVCGDCSTKTIKTSDGTTECAPAATTKGSSRPIPPCTCKGSAGCHAPCSDAGDCPTGQSCAPLTGKCQPSDNCFFFGCPTGEVCTGSRACIDNPCDPNPCQAGEACKPTPNFAAANCVPSCVGVNCGDAEVCVDGECKPTGCSATCKAGEYCLASGKCGPSLCDADSCQAGEYCDPTTRACGADPCSGVVCPAGQECSAGQCIVEQEPPNTGGAGGSTSPDGGVTGGATGNGGASNGGAGGSKGDGASAGDGNPRSAFGLATGGGGCACSVPAENHKNAAPALLAAVALASAFAGRRRAKGQNHDRSSRSGEGGVR